MADEKGPKADKQKEVRLEKEKLGDLDVSEEEAEDVKGGRPQVLVFKIGR